MIALKIALAASLVHAAVASAAVDANIEKFLDEFSCANARPGDVQVCEDLLINHVYMNSRDANGRACRLQGSDTEDCNRQQRQAIEVDRARRDALDQRRHEAARREAIAEQQRAQEQWDKTHRPGPTVARAAMPFVPGAIVCPDLETVDLMSRWMQQNSTEAFADIITKGQYSMARRPLPPVTAYLARLGCAFVPAGEPLTVLGWNGPYPRVEASLPGGRKLRGTTYPNMLR